MSRGTHDLYRYTRNAQVYAQVTQAEYVSVAIWTPFRGPVWSVYCRVGWDPHTGPRTTLFHRMLNCVYCREESSTDVGTQPHDVRPCMCCPVYFMAIALMQPECNCAHATETRFGVLPNLLAACFLMTSRADAASVSHHSCICVLRNKVTSRGVR
jgi:hypothetical protein